LVPGRGDGDQTGVRGTFRRKFLVGEELQRIFNSW
jgi:hypothetical protein